MILKQFPGINEVNNALITKKIQKHKEKFNQFFKRLIFSKVKFNGHERSSSR